MVDVPPYAYKEPAGPLESWNLLAHYDLESRKISTTNFFPAKRLKFLDGVLASILTFQIKNPPRWYDEALFYY